jgi:hypothetical protein
MSLNKCVKCISDPEFHSFKKIGQLNNSTLFYTAPAKAKDKNNDGTKYENMKLHIQKDTEDKLWIWIVDCANMKVGHYTEMNFNLKLLSLLSQESTLQEVWVLRPNAWIKTTAGLLKAMNKSNVFNRVKYLEGSNVDIFNTLQKSGLDMNTLRWLLEQ